MTGSQLFIDGAIILLYFVGILSIGLYMGRREKSLHDFALGGRNVPWWAVMASIIATETSAATFLGAPGEGYNARSIAYAQLVVGLIIGRMLVGYIFLKPYYRYKVYTVYDYLGIRFGNKSKNYVSALFLIMRTLASGTRVFIPAIVMVLAWTMFQKGAPVQYSSTKGAGDLALYFYAIVAVTVLTCIYTALGGIKAVIWTDVVQATLMFTSALVAIATLLYHIGGDSWNLMNGLRALGEVVPEMKTHLGYFWFGWEPERIQWWVTEQAKVGRHVIAGEFSWWEWTRLVLGSEFTLFSATIGAIMGNMAAFGTDQDMVQRLLTAETYQKSRRSLITAAVMDLPIASAFAFIGVLLYVYYTKDPTFKPEANKDVFGSYILNVMPTGIRGLVLAGVFATAMGSLSAALNALATSATNDWYIPYFARKKAEAHHVGAARIFTVFFAVLMILIATTFAYVTLVNPSVRIIPVVIGIAGLFLGPMLGVFLIGMLTRNRGSDAGNMIAVTVALIAMIFLSGQHIDFWNILPPVSSGDLPKLKLPEWMPVIKWTWFAMFGALIVVAIGVLFRTPDHMIEQARRRAVQASAGEDKPMYLRGEA
ncbi:MAG: sodium:solute symporter [Candidatus Sumerlaeaceae bacterium]